MKRTLLFLAFVLAAIMTKAQVELNDYIPFVKNGKEWVVINTNADSSKSLDKYRMSIAGGKEGMILAGKVYMPIFRSEHLVGYLREEERKVYLFDSNMQKEFLIFDYSLKAGDTYETYSYDEQKMVTYEVLSVGYGTTGHEVFLYGYDEKADTVTTNRRYLREWTICRTDDRSCQKTWIEGVGSLEGPLANLYDSHPVSSRSYLLYLQCNQGDFYYIPFSYYDDFINYYGCNLPSTVVPRNPEGVCQLNYEMEGDRLHIYGTLITPGPVNYAIFAEEPTDDPLVHKLNFSTQQVMMGVDRDIDRALFIETDFYLPGLDSNLNYIVEDRWGVHPVINKTPQMDYRPFVEDGKVWKVGSTTGISDSIVKMVEYYYFDGDTIIDGKTFKQMMCQRYVNHNHPDYAVIVKYPLLRKVGAWYEEDKKVYFYNATSKQFRMMYDFSLNANDTLLIDNYYPYVIGPKQTGGLEGFKGIYRDVMWCTDRDPFYCTTWLEGVGGIDGPTINIYYGEEGRALFLMSCTVGDEVIYLNDAYEDGATPEAARKDRIDFTHTIKIRPKSRSMTAEAMPSLYGEYSDQQLGINLNALDEAYQVSITDEAGKTVYEKTVNAGSIVGLNIDISSYAKGRYTVTVENSMESFTGEIDTRTTGIEDNVRIEKLKSESIYNLQGQRISTLQKGLNIVNGRKLYVK